MKSTNKKLTLDAQNFGYLNILIKIVKIQKDLDDQKLWIC
jgi:hypothetical protein